MKKVLAVLAVLGFVSTMVAVAQDAPAAKDEAKAAPAAAAAAAVVETAIHPVGIKASSTQEACKPESVINGAGLYNEGGKWLHVNDKYAEGGTMWNTNYEPAGAPGAANVVLDLGAVKQVTGLLIWNSNEKDYQARSVKDIEVSASEDGNTYTTAGRYTLNQAGGEKGEPSQEARFATPAKAKFIKILVYTSYADEAVVGLSEVAVLVTDAAATDKLLK